MRHCPKCKNDKPQTDFYTTRNVPYCKACWSNTNREYFARKPKVVSAMQTRRNSYLQNPNTCKQCSAKLLPQNGQAMHTVWSKVFCNVTCSVAFSLSTAKPKNQRSQALRKKMKKQDRAYQKLLLNYGPEIAASYKAIANDFCVHAKQRIFKIKQDFVLRHSGLKLTSKLIDRLEELNKACGFPLLNVGWHCLRCGLFHKDPRFFDVDHITPRADGGSNEPANLQCLCPNCHRIKTVGLNGVGQNQAFKNCQSGEIKPTQLQII